MNAHRLGAPVLALASHIASRQIGSGYWLCDAASEVLAHDGPALLDVVTTPDALDVPSHITAEQVRGFALALGKIVLGGGVGEVANLAPLNVRNIPTPISMAPRPRMPANATRTADLGRAR
jgi:pyruvate dehydrogenase (quinone)